MERTPTLSYLSTAFTVCWQQLLGALLWRLGCLPGQEHEEGAGAPPLLHQCSPQTSGAMAALASACRTQGQGLGACMRDPLCPAPGGPRGVGSVPSVWSTAGPSMREGKAPWHPAGLVARPQGCLLGSPTLSAEMKMSNTKPLNTVATESYRDSSDPKSAF